MAVSVTEYGGRVNRWAEKVEHNAMARAAQWCRRKGNFYKLVCKYLCTTFSPLRNDFGLLQILKCHIDWILKRTDSGLSSVGKRASLALPWYRCRRVYIYIDIQIYIHQAIASLDGCSNMQNAKKNLAAFRQKCPGFKQAEGKGM